MKQDCINWEQSVKWQLLRSAEGVRPWKSLEETRQCVLCERTFQGHQVRMTWDRCGIPRLRCPTRGCSGEPAQWIHPGNPLISEEAWRDWVRLLDTLCEEPRRAVIQRKKTRSGGLVAHRS